MISDKKEPQSRCWGQSFMMLQNCVTHEESLRARFLWPGSWKTPRIAGDVAILTSFMRRLEIGCTNHVYDLDGT